MSKPSYLHLMPRMLISKRITIAAALLLSPALFAQAPPFPASNLPPTPATSFNAPPTASLIPSTPAQQSPKHAQVTYLSGQISVVAENASLNQILRDISQQIGMKITGGVTDERVYGSYGPASPSSVLTQLLDGTGSNMLLVQSSTAVPMELVLTPRNGGPTPPNPNAPSLSDDPTARGPIGRRQPFTPGRPPNNQNAYPNQNGNIPQPPAAPNYTPTAPASSTTQQSPNGVKTPQQIYDQLQRLQQPQPQ